MSKTKNKGVKSKVDKKDCISAKEKFSECIGTLPTNKKYIKYQDKFYEKLCKLNLDNKNIESLFKDLDLSRVVFISFINFVILNKANQSDINLYSEHALPLLKKMITENTTKHKESDTMITHLHLAVEAQNESLVRYLLKLNADPSVKDHFGHSAIHLASKQNENNISTIINSYLLLEQKEHEHEHEHEHDIMGGINEDA